MQAAEIERPSGDCIKYTFYAGFLNESSCNFLRNLCRPGIMVSSGQENLSQPGTWNSGFLQKFAPGHSVYLVIFSIVNGDVVIYKRDE